MIIKFFPNYFLAPIFPVLLFGICSCNKKSNNTSPSSEEAAPSLSSSELYQRLDKNFLAISNLADSQKVTFSNGLIKTREWVTLTPEESALVDDENDVRKQLINAITEKNEISREEVGKAIDRKFLESLRPPPMITNFPEPTVILRLGSERPVYDALLPTLAEKFLQNQGLNDIERIAQGNGSMHLTSHLGNLMIEIHSAPRASLIEQLSVSDPPQVVALLGSFDKTEVSSFSRSGVDLFSPPFQNALGLQGAVFIVNKECPIDELDLGQLRAIFSGKAARWSQVTNSPDTSAISLWTTSPSDSSYTIVKRIVLSQVAGSYEAMNTAEGDSAIISAVANDRNALGLIGFHPNARAQQLNLETVKTLRISPNSDEVTTNSAILSQPANSNTVKKRDYPLSETLYLNTLSPQDSVVKNFLAFVNLHYPQIFEMDTSGELETLPATIEFYKPDKPLKPNPTSEDYNGPPKGRGSLWAYETYSQIWDQAKCADITIKFRSNESSVAEPGAADSTIKHTFEGKALADILHLSEILKSQDAPVTVIGYADNTYALSSGAWKYNLGLSESRANTVRKVLQQNGVSVRQAIGLSMFNPVGDNNTTRGKAENRRVEIWLHIP